MLYKFHFSAGYELKSVRDSLQKMADKRQEYNGLRRALSSYIVKTDCTLEKIPAGRDNRFAFVLHNMIMRGIPTLASFDLEEEFRQSLGLINFRESNTKSLEHNLSDAVSKDRLLEALYFIEPRINRTTAHEHFLNSWESHSSDFEARYLYQEIPNRTFEGHGDFLIQLFQPQREIQSILPDHIDTSRKERSFTEQRIDYSIEYPYPVTETNRRGFCVEIDGSQHEERGQQLLDKMRDDALLEADWLNTIRLKTVDFNENGLRRHFGFLNEREFSKGLYHTYFRNYRDPIYATVEGLAVLELALSPYAVARIQHTLIKAVISGFLSFEEEKWKIAVLERDVACAHLAINDLKRFMAAFSELENQGRKFPEIELDVYYTPEFSGSAFRKSTDVPIAQIGENQKAYDVFIDISILEREGHTRRHEAVIFDAFFQIRSAYYFPKTIEPFLTTNRINWGNLVMSKGDDKWEDHPVTSKALEFFIQNIFRKKSFRDGQLRILNRALRNQTVIGLLPTGGGKSLTYQLAGILQPGHVIVIDPIKSLMKDQVDSLAKIGITGTVFINSSLKDFEARIKAQKVLSNGQALFCFVSPERMMIQRFRESLSSMANEHHFFSYGVIDEVHCVSEWGHNFRTPYLSLGRNLLEYCKAADGQIALFGLTATASFDVLSDVQRELSGNKENQMIPDEAIVRHENTNRDELQYHIVKVDLENDKIEKLLKKGSKDFKKNLNQEFGLLKQKVINELLANPGQFIRRYNTHQDQVITEDLMKLTYPEGKAPSLEEVFQRMQLPRESYEGDFWSYRDEEGNDYAALVFAPHRTWYFGVTDKYQPFERNAGITESILRARILPPDKVGTFMGVDSDDEATARVLQEDNDRNQEDFVNGHQQLMVATKAFGMGIDKPNIRFTIHNNFPDSIESFVQEAGRGGRDRRLSVACVLFNDQEIPDPMKKDKIYKHDLDLQESFFWNSFKGENHEKWVLYELLNEIIFPGKDRVRHLTRILKEHPDIMDLGLDVWVSHHQPSNRLYINASEKRNFGCINYKTGQFSIQFATEDPTKSNNALNALWSIIQDLAIDISPDHMQAWLNESQETERLPGIEKILEAKKIGDEFEVLVPFVNDHSEVHQKLASILLDILGKEHSVGNLKLFSEYSRKHYHPRYENFLENLDKETGILQQLDVFSIDNPNQVEEFKSKVQSRLNRKRDKQDTEKAIFRFSVIGLIDDYTVDYSKETYVLRGRKKYPEEYHAALRFYISKYYSQKRTDNIINSLSERKGKTEIQRILNFITEFVYKEVAKKRYESISFMQECCQVGLERGNVEMKTWIHLYFNSKYARKGYSVKLEDDTLNHFSILPEKETSPGEYNASLFDWTKEGQEEEFDYVLDFMHLMEFDDSNSERDNLKHLRGACTRLSIANPDNYVFRLLRAFAVLVLEEENLKPDLKASIFEDLKKGYFHLFEREGENYDMDQAMIHYKAAMMDKLQNISAQEWFFDVLSDLEFLAHVEWTGRFKGKFTKDFIQ